MESVTQEVQIKIIQVADGIDYVPKKPRVKEGWSVSWTCDGGPFALQFLKTAPLDWAHSRQKDAKAWKGIVKKGAPHGQHDYACAAFINGVVYLDAACPAIIID